MLSLYQNADYQMLDQIKDTIGKFIDLLKAKSEDNMKLLNNLFQKREGINITKDINNYINEFKNKQIEEEHFQFEHYIPQAKLITDKICADEKEAHILNVNYRVISALKKDFNDICQEIDMAKEKEKYNLRILTHKIFNQQKDSKFSPETLEKIKNNGLEDVLYLYLDMSNEYSKELGYSDNTGSLHQ